MRTHAQKQRQNPQRGSGGPARPSPAAGRSHEVRSILHVRDQRPEHEAERLQIQRLSADATEEMEAPSIVHDVLATPGHPLDPSTRESMEHRFGQDFGQVRIHTDGRAAASAGAVDALAYTAGQNVVFGAGRYAPGTAAGDRLLAHELTHTLQQGPAAQTLRRALKFEIQTPNHVWAVKSSGAADPRLLPRKYAPTTVGYAEGSGEERGDKPAYLSVGKKGGPARAKGAVIFVEAEGPLVTEEAKSGVDPAKAAQFVKEYKFKSQVDEKDILGKAVSPGKLELVNEAENTASGTFNPNTFEFRYLNADGTQLDVHLSKDRLFKRGHVKLMKVGRGKSGIDDTKAAQFVEIYKVTEIATGDVDFLGKSAKVELVSVVDNAKDAAMKDLFNSGTWEKKYFAAADFTGKTLSGSATPLDVHMDTDGRLKPGRVKFMKKQTLTESKEQTAIELQSENQGVIEFETPKWFRKRSEVAERIQEAVDMARAINDQRGTAEEVTDATLLAAIDARKNTSTLGKIVEWPKAFSTTHLTNLRADKRRLLAQITDDTWFARIQASEGITLSEYESLMKEHEAPWARDIVVPSASGIFTTAFAAAKAKKSTLSEGLFADLKGFLQLVVNYIVRGQVEDMSGKIAKATFMLMARTNFGSMYKELLSAEEQALFTAMVGDPKKSSDNPILSELQTPINAERSKRTLGPLTLTRTSPFFFNKVGTHSTTSGPAIYQWLVGITAGKDLLSGPGISDALGARTVQKTSGEKDYKQALFEVRGTVSHGGTVTPAGAPSSFGNDRPISGWLTYALEIFDAAKARSADTPDDPRTPAVGESSKTGLAL